MRLMQSLSLLLILLGPAALRALDRHEQGEIIEPRRLVALELLERRPQWAPCPAAEVSIEAPLVVPAEPSTLTERPERRTEPPEPAAEEVLMPPPTTSSPLAKSPTGAPPVAALFVTPPLTVKLPVVATTKLLLPEPLREETVNGESKESGTIRPAAVETETAPRLTGAPVRIDPAGKASLSWVTASSM